MFRLKKKSDRQLVRQVLGGERDEYEELVKRHYPTVLSIALTYTGNSSDAEDVVQDSFVKAYTSLDKLKEPDKFLGWLSAIVRNGARKLYSKKKREQEILHQHQPASSEPAPDVSMREMMQLMRHRLDGLDDTHREVLTMYYFGGQNSTEIAQALDVNKEAVLKRLQRAREALGHEMMAAIKEPEEENSHTNQIAKITRAVIATGVAWEVAGMKTGIAAAAAVAAAKAAVIVGGFTAAGVGVYSITTNYNPATNPGDTVSSDESKKDYRTVPMITAEGEDTRRQFEPGPMLSRDNRFRAKATKTTDLQKKRKLSTEEIWDDLHGSRWSVKVLEYGDGPGPSELESAVYQLDIHQSEKAIDIGNANVASGHIMVLGPQNLNEGSLILMGNAGYPRVTFRAFSEADAIPGRNVKEWNLDQPFLNTSNIAHVMDMTGSFSDDRSKIIVSSVGPRGQGFKLEFSRTEELSIDQLDGTVWSVDDFTGDGRDDGGVNDGFRYALKTRNDKISIVEMDGAPMRLGFEGTRQGVEVEMKLTIDVPGDIDKQYTGDVSGAFGPKLNTLTLTGKIFSLDLNKNVDLVIRLQRMSDQAERELLIARYENEAEILLEKLSEFTKLNENTLPRQLRELEFTVHNHERLVQNSSIRHVSYFRPKDRKVILDPWRADMPELPGGYREMEGDSVPDKMMNFEKLLLEVRGPFPPYLFVVRVEHFDVHVSFDLDVVSKRVFQREMRPVGDDEALNALQGSLRASCANNMKQLGLSLKMYQNEARHELLAAGWASMYPEYLSDPRVLLCPSQQGGVCSYDIVYPASNRTYWKEIFANIHGSDVLYDGSKIPWIVEKNECGSGSGGRHVIFSDGRVEFIKNDDWPARMDPFMKYSYTIR
jgi:RNA polymerase sigma-70 factor (ECF subfamily)